MEALLCIWTGCTAPQSRVQLRAPTCVPLPVPVPLPLPPTSQNENNQSFSITDQLALNLLLEEVSQ